MADTITATKTIEYVNPGIRDWTGNDGKQMFFAECAFDDNSSGSVVTFSKAKAEEVQEALRQIKDVPTEFKLVEGKVFNNVQQWKIKGFPGMPEVGGGGGGGGRGGGGMSHAQAGLLAASNAFSSLFEFRESQAGEPLEPSQMAADIVELADLLTDHLFTRRGGQATGANGDSAPASEGDDGDAAKEPSSAPAPAPKDRLSLPQMTKLRELAKTKGPVEDVAGKPMGDLTPDEAAALIEAWSA